MWKVIDVDTNAIHYAVSKCLASMKVILMYYCHANVKYQL